MPEAIGKSFRDRGFSFDVLDVSSEEFGLNSNTLAALRNPFGVVGSNAVEELESKLVEEILGRAGDEELVTFFLFEGSLLWLETITRVAHRLPQHRFVVNLHNGYAIETFTESCSIRAQLFKSIMRRYLLSSSVIFTLENNYLAGKVFDLTGHKLDIYPIFTADDFVASSVKRGELIFFSGVKAKTAYSLLEGIRELSHGTMTVFPGPALEGLVELLKANPIDSVRVVDKELDKAEYTALFEDASRAWFLYFEKFNFYGSSGKVLDAISAGVVPIIPAGSALEGIAEAHTSELGRLSIRALDGKLGISYDRVVTSNRVGPPSSLWAQSEIVRLAETRKIPTESRPPGKKTGQLKRVMLLVFVSRVRIRLQQLLGQRPNVVEISK
jgi:hypothetical protein